MLLAVEAHPSVPVEEPTIRSYSAFLQARLHHQRGDGKKKADVCEKAKPKRRLRGNWIVAHNRAAMRSARYSLADLHRNPAGSLATAGTHPELRSLGLRHLSEELLSLPFVLAATHNLPQVLDVQVSAVKREKPRRFL